MNVASDQAIKEDKTGFNTFYHLDNNKVDTLSSADSQSQTATVNAGFPNKNDKARTDSMGRPHSNLKRHLQKSLTVSLTQNTVVQTT